MSGSEEAGGVARGGKNLTPPFGLEQGPRDLIRELSEANVPKQVIAGILDTRPRNTDKRLTAPLAIRSRRARVLLAELYFWSHKGGRIDDLVDELSYLMGISQRTLGDYWAAISRKGRVKGENGRVVRVEI